MMMMLLLEEYSIQCVYSPILPMQANKSRRVSMRHHNMLLNILTICATITSVVLHTRKERDLRSSAKVTSLLIVMSKL